MTTSTANHQHNVNDRIVQKIMSNSTCPNCHHEMEMSMFVNMNADRPLQVSWVCGSCKHLRQSEYKRNLNMPVSGTSRSERAASILYITKLLTGHTRNGSQYKHSVMSQLMQIVADEGILLSYLDLAYMSVRGVCFEQDGLSYIMLDESLKTNQSEHVAVLAEEVGRHFARKSGSHNTESDAREEVLALRWAVSFLSSVSCDMYGRAS